MTACVDCHQDPKVGSTRCRSCYDRRRRHGPRGTCTRCAKQRTIYDPAGRCDLCVYLCRPQSPRLDPPCAGCGQQRRHLALGRCSACYQKMPEGIWIYAAGLANRLDAGPPNWFDGFVGHIAERYSPSEARLRLRELSRLLPTSPTAETLVAAARHPDGRVSPLSRALEEFFAAKGILKAIGDTETRATRRRARVISRVPVPLRPAVAAFSTDELANRDRAIKTGAKPRSDQTLLLHLDVIADFAQATPKVTNWATVAEADIEAFLAHRSPANTHILGALHAFFGWARRTRQILIDPTRAIRSSRRRCFTGPIVDLNRQRELFTRWTTDPTITPNEATIGLLCLLHACSSDELRHITITDIDQGTHTLNIKGRPGAVPLDPATWTAIETTIRHRRTLHTANPHLLVNRRTKTTNQPASSTYPKDLLQPLGTTPQRLRCTRLAQLVTTVDPILVAELFGLTNSGVLYYLGDTVDDIRLHTNP